MRDSGDEDAPGQRDDRPVHQRCEIDGAEDQRDVEQNGREGRDAETLVGIEDAAGEGGQGDEQEIGKGQAQHLGGECQLLGIVHEARGEDQDQHRRAEHAEHRDQQQHGTERSGDRIHIGFQGLEAALLLVLVEYRHEGHGEGAFGKQSAHEVRDLEGDEEGVRSGVCAEDSGDHQVAHEAEDPREKGVATDLGDRGGE